MINEQDDNRKQIELNGYASMPDIFTKEEIDLALENNFTAVALGDTRLRTETAALVAATLLCVS